MSCKTCQTPTGAVTCLFCGHAFCPVHRGELDGVTACTACLQAEHQRRAARGKSGPAPRQSARGVAPSEAQVGASVAPVPAPPPLPEPGSPLLVHGLSLLAGGGMGLYLWWLAGWLRARHEQLPEWLAPASGVAGGLLAGLGVWIIAKTRLAPEQQATTRSPSP